MSEVDLTDILDEVVDYRFKGFPPTQNGVTIGTVGQRGWNALTGDLQLPMLVLKERAMQHNIDLMATYCRERNVSLAPHAKTPMAPQIVQRQLEAGAWGVTVANVPQAQVFRMHGGQRILMANELLDRTGIAWVAEEISRDPDFEFFFLVDSLAGVDVLSDTLERLAPPRPLQVLIELGTPGGRTGCRTQEEACAVAMAIHAAPHLLLAGVEGYEGAVPGATLAERIDAVDRYLCDVRDLTMDLDQAGLFEGRDEIIVTARSQENRLLWSWVAYFLSWLYITRLIS